MRAPMITRIVARRIRLEGGHYTGRRTLRTFVRSVPFVGSFRLRSYVVSGFSRTPCVRSVRFRRTRISANRQMINDRRDTVGFARELNGSVMCLHVGYESVKRHNAVSRVHIDVDCLNRVVERHL